MHFSSIIIITTALIAASPTLAYDPCPGHTYPKCCGIDVLGIADVECNTPRVAPISFDLFEATCAQQGKGPKCCAIPVGGSALFCVDPVTSSNPSPAAPNNQNPLGGTPSPASNDSPSNGNPPDEGPSGPVCPLLYSNPQCCATDVLGIADLDCTTPTSAANNGKELNANCAKSGKQAACCTLPLLGQGVLCIKPVGV